MPRGPSAAHAELAGRPRRASWPPTQSSLAASLPEGWRADVGHNEIIPVDTWHLHPQGVERAGVRLMLAWLPRLGRHSAGFPGGLDGDEAPAVMNVGGVERRGERFDSRKGYRADFEVGELAVSVIATVREEEDWPAVRAVLRALRFAPDARPAVVSEARSALDLARRWAAARGTTGGDIVYTGPAAAPGRHHFTVFHGRELTSLVITPSTGAVVAR